MNSNIGFLLGKIDEGLARVEARCQNDLGAKAVSNEMLYEVRRVIQDCQSALDWTASAVDARYGSRGRPYFPIGRDQADFEKKLDAQIPGLRRNRPHIADAFERHQPYRPGCEVLAQLHELSRVNKHQDFSPQTRTERRTTRVEVAGASAEWAEGVRFAPGVAILGVPIDAGTQRPTLKAGATVTNVTYVDWRFVNPNLSVRPTLRSLARAVREAVLDVSAAAEV